MRVRSVKWQTPAVLLPPVRSIWKRSDSPAPYGQGPTIKMFVKYLNKVWVFDPNLGMMIVVSKRVESLYILLRDINDYFNGSTDGVSKSTEERLPVWFLRLISLNSLLWPLWWGILLGIILLFCGQSSKFIYIDF